MSGSPRKLATLEGYAVEGGFDTPGGIATCFGPAGHLGQTTLPGDADGLWSRYESVIDAASGLAIDGVRLTLEWARLEPAPGRPDDAAFARYREVASHARAHGLRVVGVLVDAAWPAWLGQAAWLMPWIDEHVVGHAARVVEHLGETLDGVVPFARPRAMVDGGFCDGTSPPWRRREREDSRDALAHVATLSRTLETGPLRGLVVDRWREVPALVDAAAMAELLRAPDVDEFHVRSLVAGHGATSCPNGLLTLEDGTWRVSDAGRALS